MTIGDLIERAVFFTALYLFAPLVLLVIWGLVLYGGYALLVEVFF